MKFEYQQGDLIFIQTNRVPPSAQLQLSADRVQIGTDANGQPHTAVLPTTADYLAVASFYAVGKTRFLELPSPALIEHLAHASIQIQPGVYKVRKESQYTYAEHGQGVSQLVLLIGRALQLDEQHLSELAFAAMMHDMGAVGMEEMLWEPQRFSDAQWEEFRQHPVRGANLVAALKGRIPEATDRVCEYVRHHHEHFDGSGYPDALKGELIPLGSRILIIAEAYEAMTSRRPHRPPFQPYQAIERLYSDAGKRMDRRLLDIFVDALDNQL